MRMLVFIQCLTGISGCMERKAGLVYLPEAVVFAGDTIPISESDIRERLEREILINQYWYSNTSQWIRKSSIWFPLIDSILQANAVPRDFRYLVAVESGFENVSSPKGAAGFWQLMEGTAIEAGLLISPGIDERFHPEKSGEAACRLLNKGYREFRSWTATAVSYNLGISGLRSVINAQYSDSVFDLLLNQESGRYLFRILAAKLILENPEKYGFAGAEPFPVYKWKNYELSDSIPDLPWWCRNRGFSYKCFRILNPWIRTGRIQIPAGRKSLRLRLPLDCNLFSRNEIPLVPASDSEASVNHYVEANLVERKEIGRFEAKGNGPAEIPITHIVEKGENLSRIAAKYGFSISEIFSLNPQLSGKGGEIREGSVLRLTNE